MKVKKLMILLTMFAMIFSCSPSVFATSYESGDVTSVVTTSGPQVIIEDGTHFSVVPSIAASIGNTSDNSSNSENSEYFTYYEVNSIETSIYPDGQYKTTCVVTGCILNTNEITPRTSETAIKEDTAISATITLTYFLRNNGEDIKITNVSGQWSQVLPDTGIGIRNQEVFVSDGVPFSAAAIYYPTAWSFDYDLPWDYVQFYPTTTYSGPYATSTCEYNITGMGTMWVNFSCRVNIVREV